MKVTSMWEFVDEVAAQWEVTESRNRLVDEAGDDVYRKATLVIALETARIPTEKRRDWIEDATAFAQEILPDGAVHWIQNWERQVLAGEY